MTDQRPMPKAKHRTRKIVALVLIVAILVPLVLYARARLQWSSRIDRQIKAIKEAGLPTTFAELNAWYRLPEGAVENAADYYLEAFNCYCRPNEVDANQVPLAGSGRLPGRSEPLPESTTQAMTRFVAANKRTLDLLYEAGGMTGCRYPVDFRKRQAVLMPWLSEIRKCVGLLGCEAILYAERGQSAEAVRSLETSLRLGNSLATEPTLVSQLVRISCRAAVVVNLERMLNRTELTSDQLLAVDLALEKTNDPNAFRRGFVGERVFGVDLMESPMSSVSASGSGAQPSQVLIEAYSALGLSRRDQAEYLEIMAARCKALDLPESKRLVAQGDVDRQERQIPGTHILVRMFTPALGRTTELELRSLAHVKAARTSLAIERYRLKAGGLPAELASLVPEYLASVPMDPFTGQPIKYRPLAKGYVAYSVGGDLTDDSGRERPAHREPGEPEITYDITFVVER